MGARDALAQTLRGALPAVAGVAAAPVTGGRREAAVLVALSVAAAGEVRVVLTERRADLRRHPGEISFPGGRRDPGDRDLAATALRETHEELGLPPAAVQLVGALLPVGTFVSDYAVHPFVGLIEPGFAWVPAEAEVGRVLEPTLGELRAAHARQALPRRGIPPTDVYALADAFVWGATARILADLLGRLG